MKIDLYHNSDAPNVVGKTLNVVAGLEIRFRGSFDVMNPVLVLKFVGDPSVNYARIDTITGPRFYFINELENVGGNVWRCHLAIDVLETHRDLIKGSFGRYRRNLKTGDYVVGGLEMTHEKVAVNYNSDKGFGEGESLILTTVGG